MKGWQLAGSNPSEYDSGIDRQTLYNGKISAFIVSKEPPAGGFGSLAQMFKADDYRGKRFRISSYLKTQDVTGWAGLWMRIDGPDGRTNNVLGFDNMQNRPVKGTQDWAQYSIVLDVPPESEFIAFGLLLNGKGKVWLSDFKFEEVGPDIAPTSLVPPVIKNRPENLDFEEV